MMTGPTAESPAAEHTEARAGAASRLDVARVPASGVVSEEARPLSAPRALGRGAPFALATVLAFATVTLFGPAPRQGALLAATAVTLALAAAAFFVPWRRLPAWTEAIPPLSFFPVIALLRDAVGGGPTGYAPLLFLPILWLALYGSRRQLVVGLALGALTLVVPVVLVGAPQYPDTELRRAVLFVAIASLMGFVVQQLVQGVREREREARERADELTQAAHHRHAQHAVATVLAESDTAEDALLGVLNAIGKSTGWQAGTFWLLDADASRSILRCAAFWSAPERDTSHYEAATRNTRFHKGEGLPGRTLDMREPVWVPDVLEDEAFARARAAASDDLHAAVCVPVLSGIEPVGVIEFVSDEIRPLRRSFLDSLEAISQQVGQFIERKRAEAAAERLKAEFFALVSHELRTPLTSIIGYLELLSEEGSRLSEDGRSFLEVIERNANRLERLVGDLLLVAQVEAGTFALALGDIRLDALAADAVAAARPRARREGVELALEAESMPSCAGDPQRLAQVFDNLMSNAIKFTPAGGRVTVRVGVRGSEATVEVVDTGVGIPSDEQANLFDRFYRTARAEREQVQGVGLGLSIVKAIVESHGGAIRMSSEEGSGTTFSVTLPLRSGPGRAATSGTRARGSPINRKRSEGEARPRLD
jgi:signal transduction histidine kinase